MFIIEIVCDASITRLQIPSVVIMINILRGSIFFNAILFSNTTNPAEVQTSIIAINIHKPVLEFIVLSANVNLNGKLYWGHIS